MCCFLGARLSLAAEQKLRPLLGFCNGPQRRRRGPTCFAAAAPEYKLLDLVKIFGRLAEHEHRISTQALLTARYAPEDLQGRFEPYSTGIAPMVDWPDGKRPHSRWHLLYRVGDEGITRQNFFARLPPLAFKWPVDIDGDIIAPDAVLQLASRRRNLQQAMAKGTHAQETEQSQWAEEMGGILDSPEEEKRRQQLLETSEMDAKTKDRGPLFPFLWPFWEDDGGESQTDATAEGRSVPSTSPFRRLLNAEVSRMPISANAMAAVWTTLSRGEVYLSREQVARRLRRISRGAPLLGLDQFVQTVLEETFIPPSFGLADLRRAKDAEGVDDPRLGLL
ncbi:unnamed protein product [Vitrella brassicaformis CCMP3155]|uniref:Uncharacterized protein n=1 Tax=Vitrella brassicaformis (strain CCMP3155) TaxID=1169540 RepID=A0A0G4ETJ0_VITBC|nr:unnamed protein product [Vitrella brassicaformis CCMP3155]|eukprot:CEM01759.1 unnamed protein product [Vitrella brassicaformis CCMP3155]